MLYCDRSFRWDGIKRLRSWCVYYQKGAICIAVLSKCIGTNCLYYKEDYNKKLAYEQRAGTKLK